MDHSGTTEGGQTWIPAQPPHTGETGRGPMQGTTERRNSYRIDCDFEPPRPLAALHRDAKRANSPANMVLSSRIPRSVDAAIPPPLWSFDYCLTTFDDSLTALTIACRPLAHRSPIACRHLPLFSRRNSAVPGFLKDAPAGASRLCCFL